MLVLTITKNIPICVICLKTSPNVYNLASPMLHHHSGKGWKVLILMQLLTFPGSYRSAYEIVTSI